MDRRQGTAKRSPARRGRPPLTWLDGDDVAALPVGTAIALERTGGHTARLIGRVIAQHPTATQLATPRGDLEVAPTQVRRARVIAALYEPGDPVLRRGVAESVWRGGVVRAEGTEVLVEQLDGAFVWISEGDLEPADARDPVAPAERRGPVPASVR